MTLSDGALVGPYQVIALVGAGGMGEVYRARDTALHRDIALKVLPASLSGEPARLTLFRREAQVLASLNHPNIAHIHGIEQSGPVLALVMEFVEGPTLADRLTAGRMPLAEVLPIARQIAEALESAHERGVVHRDLKPADIKIRPDGTIKVLDFGIAKALELPGAGEADPLSSARVHGHTDPAGGAARHGGVYVARTGPGQGGRSPHGHLGVRRGGLRDGDRRTVV
jgi:eukaryotic-like serine/threonine-protein kinase